MQGSSPNSIFNALSENMAATSAESARTEGIVTIGYGVVLSVSDDYSQYTIKFKDNMQTDNLATLAFDAEFYTSSGFPKVSDSVVLMHCAHQNTRILFREYPKIEKDVPFGGAASMKAFSVPSATCW
jgi:hypothetical protein